MQGACLRRYTKQMALLHTHFRIEAIPLIMPGTSANALSPHFYGISHTAPIAHCRQMIMLPHASATAFAELILPRTAAPCPRGTDIHDLTGGGAVFI